MLLILAGWFPSYMSGLIACRSALLIKQFKPMILVRLLREESSVDWKSFEYLVEVERKTYRQKERKKERKKERICWKKRKGKIEQKSDVTERNYYTEVFTQPLRNRKDVTQGHFMGRGLIFLSLVAYPKLQNTVCSTIYP